MTNFDPENVNPTVSDEARMAIADLVLSWARFDALMSQMIILAFDLDLDVGAILIGNMDTRAKFDRIIKLYEHFGMPGAQKFKELKVLHAKHVDLRNTICHAGCGGTLKSDPARIVFAPVRIMKGETGSMMIEVVHLDSIRAAAVFAQKNGDQLNLLIEHFHEKQEGR